MTTKPTEARAALNMLGIQPNSHATPAMMYGWLAAEAFASMIGHDHGSEVDLMRAHHEFGNAFGSQLASASGADTADAWSMALTLLGFAIPTPAIADPIQTGAAPYAALRLAAGCCAIMAGPDDERNAPAVAAVLELAGRFAALGDREHLIASARRP